MGGQSQIKMDEIYKNTPLREIPWNMESPPELLAELVDNGKVLPCKAIDLGCGAGNYVIYLAERGFEVTGVDFSPTAIRIAKKNAEKKSVKCNFFVADVTSQMGEFDQNWDFLYDWSMLHHIFPAKRQKYVENVWRIANPKGKYLSVCFSEEDTGFEGSEKYRKTPLGSVLYLSSEDELSKLFEPYFQIIDLRTTEICGKFDSHVFNYVFMQRK